MDDKEALIVYARKLKAAGLVSIGCNKGSISKRIDAERFIIAPSRLDYDELMPQDLNTMYLDGREYDCRRTISMDTRFHCAIYSARADVQCIIHTHARYTTALAFAGKEIPYIQYAMKLQFGGKVELCDFYFPDEVRLNLEMMKKLGEKNAVILKNHGGIAVGKSLKNASENMIYLEELSESYVHALMIGNIAAIQ